jgi:pyruvate dehydrogenase E2 component (dihydrolipoamide acetyltransferase)
MTEVDQTNIFMPALSSTMTEGKIVSWLKSEGDEVRAGEAIMVVESDKADMDVEAFEDGFLAKIVVGEGEQAEVGALVGVIVPNRADIASVQISSSSGVATPPSAGAATVAAPAAATPSATAAVPDCEFTRIDMPALSSTMKEGKIVSWLKAEGDAVSSGEAIMVVESDKADMDVEAFEDGFLAAIITGEGDSCSVGAPVAIIATSQDDIPTLKAYAATLVGGGSITASPAAAAPAVAVAAPLTVTKPKATTATAASSDGRIVASPLAKKRAAEAGLDLSTVVGTGPDGRITGADVEKAIATGGTVSKSATTKSAESKPTWTPSPGVIAATPTAKAFAKKAGLDISTIKGTGNFGRVTIDDVKAATGEKKKQPAKKKTDSNESAPELPDGLVPFTGMQKAVSNNMEKSLSVPIFRCSRDIITNKFDDLYQVRRYKCSYTSFGSRFSRLKS